MHVGERRPHRCRERTLPLPRYGLPDKTGISVWVETRRSGDRHGIEYAADRDGTATLQVITSMLPGPDPWTLLGGDGGEPLTVQGHRRRRVRHLVPVAEPEPGRVYDLARINRALALAIDESNEIGDLAR